MPIITYFLSFLRFTCPLFLFFLLLHWLKSHMIFLLSWSFFLNHRTSKSIEKKGIRFFVKIKILNRHLNKMTSRYLTCFFFVHYQGQRKKGIANKVTRSYFLVVVVFNRLIIDTIVYKLIEIRATYYASASA